MSARALVVAKAPVVGEVKTRLGRELAELLGAEGGMRAAATVAAAALWDTVEACEAAFGPGECHLALAGDLREAVDGDRLTERLAGWTIHPQRGTGLGERLAHAHRDAGHLGPVVQVGMDTPQVTVSLLRRVAAEASAGQAVLGPAEDGGWWVLALGSPAAALALVDVHMSRPDTYEATRAALQEAGADVVATRTLRDVDTVADAQAVAVEAPDGHFARAWARVAREELVR